MSTAPARTAAHTRRSGFTLVEVVAAMGILLLGMSVIIGLLSFGAALSRTAALRTSAAGSLDAVVADLETSLFPMEPDGSAGEPVPVVDRDVPGHRGLVYSATATVNPDSVGVPGRIEEYRVDVQISWKERGARRSRDFTTVLARQIPFGERLRIQFVEGRTGPDTPGSAPDDAAADS